MTKKNKEEKSQEEFLEIKTEEKRDYIFAIFLIFVGSVLLLNTTGLVEWNIWSLLWRFWPLIIVFAGLNLIFESSKWVSIFLAAFSLTVLVLIFLWSATLLNLQNVSDRLNMPAPVWFRNVVEKESDIKSTLTVSQDKFTNIEEKNISIDMDVGDLRISNENSQNHLSLESEYLRSFGEPELKTKVKNDVLKVDLALGNKGGFSFFQNQSPVYSLVLGTDEIPTNLLMKVGAGRSEIFLKNYDLNSFKFELGAGDSKTTLSSIAFEELEINVGVGNFVLDLDGETSITKPIKLKVGAGRLQLILPENAEYKLEGDLGIGSIKTLEKTFSGVGQDFSGYKSGGYDYAELKFDIVAEVGLGELVIK